MHGETVKKNNLTNIHRHNVKLLYLLLNFNSASQYIVFCGTKTNITYF